MLVVVFVRDIVVYTLDVAKDQNLVKRIFKETLAGEFS